MLLERDQKVWPCWNRRGFVGGSVLLGEDFEVSEAHAKPKVSLFLLPANPGAELSVPYPVPFLSVCQQADSGINL